MKNTTQYDHWIVCGPDRMGKSSLIDRIQNEFGYHHYIHYEKPKKTPFHYNDLKTYQKYSFEQGFELLNTDIKTIYDRFHLGEYVYSEMYRDYLGDYVFPMEEWCMTPHGHASTKLILLVSSDLSFIEDDGDNFDFSQLEEEQKRFVDAYYRSSFKNKVLVDVHDQINGGFKPFEQVFKEAMK